MAQGLAEAAAEKQESPIDAILNKQRRLLSNLLEEIDRAQIRLGSISVPATQSTSEVKRPGLGAETPVPMHIKSRIADSNETIELATARIREIMSNLEL